MPTAVSAFSTSDGSQLELGADVGETVSSACCAVRAPVWMVSLVLTTRLVSERSASSTWDLMPADSISRARHQVFAGLAPAAFDAAGDGLDARAEQVLELRDAGVDVAGDGADAGLDALMDFLEPRRDGVGQMGAAAIDGFGDVGDAMVDRRDRLRGAVGQRRGEQAEARVDRVDRLRRAVGQRGRASVPRRPSMVSVTDLARVSKVSLQRLAGGPSIDLVEAT